MTTAAATDGTKKNFALEDFTKAPSATIAWGDVDEPEQDDEPAPAPSSGGRSAAPSAATRGFGGAGRSDRPVEPPRRDGGARDRGYGGGGGGGGDRRGGGGGGGSRGGDRGDRSDRGDRGDRGAGASSAPRAALPVPDVAPFNAYVGNLDFNVGEADIAEFFAGTSIKDIRLIVKEGKFRGYAYVDFNDRESLVNALSLNNTSWSGRDIRVDVAEGRQQKSGGFGGRDGGRGGDRDGGSRGYGFRSEGRDGGRGGGSDRGDRRAGGSSFGGDRSDRGSRTDRPDRQERTPRGPAAGDAAPPEPVEERPWRLTLNKPTTPVGIAPKSTIFGGGRTREEVLAEKKAAEAAAGPPATTPATAAPAASPEAPKRAFGRGGGALRTGGPGSPVGGPSASPSTPTPIAVGAPGAGAGAAPSTASPTSPSTGLPRSAATSARAPVAPGAAPASARHGPGGPKRTGTGRLGKKVAEPKKKTVAEVDSEGFSAVPSGKHKGRAAAVAAKDDKKAEPLVEEKETPAPKGKKEAKKEAKKGAKESAPEPEATKGGAFALLQGEDEEDEPADDEE